MTFVLLDPTLVDRAPANSTLYSLPGNCSPTRSQRHQHSSDGPESLRSTLPHELAMGSHSFLTLAESARTRHDRDGSAAADAFELSTSPQDAIMSSHEPRSHVESSRGRRTPAPASAGQGASHPVRARSSRSRSPAKRSRSPDKAPPIPRSITADSLAERRHYPRPSAINTDTARQHGSVSKKTVVVESQTGHRSHQAAIVAALPSTPPLRSPLRRMPRIASPTMTDSGEDDGSSYYSEDEFGQAHPSYISPLRVRRGVDSENNAVLRSYSVWGKSASPEHSPERMVYSPTTRTGSPHRSVLPRIQLRSSTPPSPGNCLLVYGHPRLP